MYDNNSSRIQKQTGYSGSTNLTRYLNNDFEIENQETLDGSGNILTQTKTNKYIYLGNNKIFTVENKDNTENIVYNISDHLGGGSIDINNTGTVLQKSDYLPYGGNRVLEKSNDYKNNYLFTGKEFDSETGLQYFEVRYYNSDFGRFYGQDKVFWELGNTKRGLQVFQDPQQLNSYSYARNNPIIYVDPSGEFIETGWDMGNVLYDAGRGIKNVGELIGGGIAYGVGAYTGNNYLKDAASNGMKSDINDLGEVGVDIGTDAAATLIPFIPAGTSKAARGITKINIDGFKKLEKHFKDHGSDFGAKNSTEYYKKAKDFLGGTKNDGVLEKVNKHGDSIIRYDPKSNTFGSVNKENGTIRTFFKPEGNGKDYFNNQ